MSTPDAAPVEVEGGRTEVELFTPQTRENLIAAMAKIAAIDDVLGGTEVSTQAHLSSTSMTFRFAKRAPSIEDSLSFATVIEQSPGKLYDAIRRLLAADDEIRRLRALPAAPTTPDIADERVRTALRAIIAKADKDSRCSCTNGWTEDENWSPEDLRGWDGTRSEGDGLIPCGLCNLGGWGHDMDEPMPPPSTFYVSAELIDAARAALATPSTPGAGWGIAESARREHVPGAPVTTACPDCGRTDGWCPDPRRKPYGDYLAAGHCQDCGYVWGDQTPTLPEPATGQEEPS